MKLDNDIHVVEKKPSVSVPSVPREEGSLRWEGYVKQLGPDADCSLLSGDIGATWRRRLNRWCATQPCAKNYFDHFIQLVAMRRELIMPALCPIHDVSLNACSWRRCRSAMERRHMQRLGGSRQPSEYRYLRHFCQFRSSRGCSHA